MQKSINKLEIFIICVGICVCHCVIYAVRVCVHSNLYLKFQSVVILCVHTKSNSNTSLRGMLFLRCCCCCFSFSSNILDAVIVAAFSCLKRHRELKSENQN